MLSKLIKRLKDILLDIKHMFIEIVIKLFLKK